MLSAIVVQLQSEYVQGRWSVQWVTMTLLSENSCIRRDLVKISLHDLVKISYPEGSCTSKERIEGKSDKTDGRNTAPHLPVYRLQIKNYSTFISAIIQFLDRDWM